MSEGESKDDMKTTDTSLECFDSLGRYQAWMAGHLEGALTLTEVVLKDARENLGRHPGDKKTQRAIDLLQAATANLLSVANTLYPTGAQSIESATAAQSEPAH